MNQLPTFDTERIFEEYVKTVLHRKNENVELGGDTVKFTELSTGKTFLIIVREELPGKKIIVVERSKEKKAKVKSKGWFKPI